MAHKARVVNVKRSSGEVIVRGMWRIVRPMNNRPKYRMRKQQIIVKEKSSGSQTDKEAMRSDWVAIGDDIRKAIQKHEDAIKETPNG
jgi:hypothetical protein